MEWIFLTVWFGLSVWSDWREEKREITDKQIQEASRWLLETLERYDCETKNPREITKIVKREITRQGVDRKALKIAFERWHLVDKEASDLREKGWEPSVIAAYYQNRAKELNLY